MSDLWNAVSGLVNITWYDWTGKVLSSSKSNVDIGPTNATIAFELNVQDLGLDLSSSIAKCSVEVQHGANNSHSKKLSTYKHERWFHAQSLSQQALPDPRLTVKNDPGSNAFVVKADGGVAAWTWSDHPDGVVGNFEEIRFWLLPKQEKKVALAASG